MKDTKMKQKYICFYVLKDGKPKTLKKAAKEN